MDWNAIFEMIEIIAIACIAIIDFCGLKKLNDSYMEEKGKNLATKEDIQELTSLAEEIKTMYQSKLYISEHIYDIKLTAVQESLDFLDDYLSWLNYNSDVVPIRDETITSKELTFRARQCYNKLVLTCDSVELPEVFLKMIFENPHNEMGLYNKYRNLSRKEMGMVSMLELSSEKVFISKVSTKSIE